MKVHKQTYEQHIKAVHKSRSINCKNKYYKTPKECKHCKCIISYEKRLVNVFCSKSCAATYNNIRKTKGTRVSKLEKWLQKQLIDLYPDLDFHFNCKNEDIIV